MASKYLKLKILNKFPYHFFKKFYNNLKIIYLNLKINKKKLIFAKKLIKFFFFLLL